MIGINLLDSSSSSSSEDEYVRRPKRYNKRKNYLEIYNDRIFFKRFRLTKETFNLVLRQIQDRLQPMTRRSGSIQPAIQLLLTLRFYATGSMQKSAAYFCGVSTASASRIIKRVSQSIAMLAPRYINMAETTEEMEKTAEEFYKIARFPRVVGAIDCTLVKIMSPGGDDAEIFRTKKNFFGINVQTVSDSKLYIRDIVARWPGSTHGQTIFNNSSLKRLFEEGHFGRYVLIGDSEYQLKPFLMTKVLNVQTPTENLYNESFIKTRNVVERQYSVWKRRFPVLRTGLAVKLETTLIVIVATAVLHNIALEQNETILDEWLIPLKEENVMEVEEHAEPSGQLARLDIINNHFGQL